MPSRPIALGLLALGALLAGCSSSREGVALEVGVMHHPGAGHDVHYPAGVERGIVTDQGYGVALHRAQLVIGRVELRECADAQQQSGITGALLHGLGELLSPVSVAHAHGVSEPTVVAEPNVLDLMDEDHRMLSIARMEPPPGAYCGVLLRVDVADLDAGGLPADGALVGRSLLVEGSFTDPEQDAEQAFSYTSDLPDEIELPFVDTDGEPTRITLAIGKPMAELRIELGYYALLDGIDLRARDPALDGYTIVHNLLSSTRAVAGDVGELEELSGGSDSAPDADPDATQP